MTRVFAQRNHILGDPRLPEIFRITLAQNLDMELFLKVHPYIMSHIDCAFKAFSTGTRLSRSDVDTGADAVAFMNVCVSLLASY